MMHDLNLIHWFETTQNGDQIWDKQSFLIKQSLNLEELKTHPKTKTGGDLYEQFQHSEVIPYVEYFLYEDEINGRNVIMRFLTIKNTELLTSEDIQTNSVINNTIHRHLIFTHDLAAGNGAAINKRYEIMQQELETKKYLNLKEIEVPDLRTKLFPNQVHNINFMVEREGNLPKERFYEGKLLSFPDGRLYDYSKQKFIEKEEIPLSIIKGGINFDEVGIGKTLQMLCLYRINPCPTVVLVPNHLVHQWMEEIRKHFVCEFPLEIRPFSEIGNLEHYERIIVDEFHELFQKKNNEILEALCQTTAKYKWGVTGTAFDSLEVKPLLNILNFLTDNSFTNDFVVRYLYYQDIYKSFFVRNLRENLEMEFPNCQMMDKILDFNEIERSIYQAERLAGNNLDEDALREICCDVILKFHQQEQVQITKEDFMKDVIGNFEEKMNSKLRVVNEIEERIEKLEEELMITISEFRKHELNKTKEIYLKNLEKATNDYHERKRSYDFIRMKFEEHKENCAICVSEIEDNYTFLECGHYFHTGCIGSWFRMGYICPFCRTKLSKDQIYEITNGEVPPQLYSTKLMELKKIVEKNDKTIVFTQFPKLIRKIRDFLNSIQIRSETLDENILDKINRFERGDFKVLILSSMENASGLNLQFCQNLVIFEPVKGNFVFLKEIEKQIVGRIMRLGQDRECFVTRLIIKDTIEEEIYSQY